MSSKLALVTGSAGFIGFHLSQRLLAQGYKIAGVDNLNDYYHVTVYGANKRMPFSVHQNVDHLISFYVATKKAFHPDPATSFAPYRLYNTGNTKPVGLMYYIEILEQKLERKAVNNFLPMQDGEVTETYSSVDDLMNDVIQTVNSDRSRIGKFVDWYLDYYQIKR